VVNAGSRICSKTMASCWMCIKIELTQRWRWVSHLQKVRVLHASVHKKTKCPIWYTKDKSDLTALPVYQSIYPSVPMIIGAEIAMS
jgi:hypothetical protein